MTRPDPDELLEKLASEHSLAPKDYETLIGARSRLAPRARELAVAVRKEIYGNDVYVRGLIEIRRISTSSLSLSRDLMRERIRISKEPALVCR